MLEAIDRAARAPLFVQNKESIQGKISIGQWVTNPNSMSPAAKSLRLMTPSRSTSRTSNSLCIAFTGRRMHYRDQRQVRAKCVRTKEAMARTESGSLETPPET